MVYDRIADYIKKFNDFLIISDNDLDGKISALLIKIILKKLGKNYKIVIRDHGDLENLKNKIKNTKQSIIVLLDSPYKDKDLIDAAKTFREKTFLYIDHHKRTVPENVPDNLKYYDIRALGLEVISVAEIIYRVGKIIFGKEFEKYSCLAMIGAIGDWLVSDSLLRDFTEVYKGVFAENTLTPSFLELYNIFNYTDPKYIVEYGELLIEDPLQFFKKINPRKLLNKLSKFLKSLKDSRVIAEGNKFLLIKTSGNVSGVATFMSALIKDKVTIFFSEVKDDVLEKLFPKYLKLSLRNRDKKVDVGLLIKEFTSKYGIMGGGHPEAAGGKIWKKDLDKFIEYLKEKLG